jgi:vitamin B12 transporter
MSVPTVPIVLTVLTVLTVPAVLTAQTLDSTRLKEITVTANRAPTPLRALGSSADVLGAAELYRRQVHSLSEALSLVPGGAALANGAPGGVASVFLRGVSSSQTLLLVDGIRINDANTSYGSFLAGEDLGGLGHLEVVRGPESTLYGGAAIGGVVSMDAAPAFGPGRADLELEGGSFSTWRGSGVASAGSERAGIRASVTANGTDNQRHPNGWDQRTELVRLDRRVAAGLSVGATFRGLQQRYTSPGDIRSDNTTPDGTTIFENNLGTVWVEAVPSPAWRSRLIIGGQQQFTQGTGRFDGGPEFKFNLTNSRRVIDWQNTVRLRPGVLVVAGANREWSTAAGDGTALDERLWAWYGEGRFTPVAPVTVTAGIRNDDYTTFERALTWRVTGAWSIRRGATKLRASYGTGFMPPSLAARFGNVFQAPNPGIRPERSRGWDAGLDQGLFGGKGAVSVTWFRNALRDLIVYQGADFPALGKNLNLDRARTSGVEVSGRMAAGPVDARLAWTVLSARSLSESDPALAPLIRRPRHTLAADLALAITRRGTLGAGVLAVANRQDTDFNAFPSARVNPGDYAIARLYAAYDLDARITLRARIENLFDTRYEPVYGFPGLGRSVTAGAAVRLRGSAPQRFSALTR